MSDKTLLEQVEDSFQELQTMAVGDLMGYLHTLAHKPNADLQAADEVCQGIDNLIGALRVVLKEAEKVREVHRKMNALSSARETVQASLKTLAETEFGLDLQ